MIKSALRQQKNQQDRAGVVKKKVTIRNVARTQLYEKPPKQCDKDMYGFGRDDYGMDALERLLVCMDLNEFKTREMIVHPASQQNTSLSRLKMESFAERAARLECLYGEDAMTAEDRIEVEEMINDYDDYVKAYEKVEGWKRPEKVRATLINLRDGYGLPGAERFIDDSAPLKYQLILPTIMKCRWSPEQEVAEPL